MSCQKNAFNALAEVGDGRSCRKYIQCTGWGSRREIW